MEKLQAKQVCCPPHSRFLESHIDYVAILSGFHFNYGNCPLQKHKHGLFNVTKCTLNHGFKVQLVFLGKNKDIEKSEKLHKAKRPSEVCHKNL